MQAKLLKVLITVSYLLNYLSESSTLSLLLLMYTRQSLRVKWGNTVSSEITVSNGVKQGGVL